MVSVRVPKPVSLVEIKKTHDLLILLELHIYRNICPLASLSPSDFSLPLYILRAIAVRNVSFLVDIAPSNKTLSIYPHWVQKVLMVFPYRINFYYLISRLYRVFSIISKMPSIPINHLSPTQWYSFDNVRILWIHQTSNYLRIPRS